MSNAVIDLIKSSFRLKEAPSLEVMDSAQAFDIHKAIIDKKPLLKQIYDYFYLDTLKYFGNTSGKKIVEIGAGAYNASAYSKDIITSDVMMNDHVKMAVDAQNMPFSENELDGLLVMQTLHHIPRPKLFFLEAMRCLKPGAKMVFLEPNFSLWGSVVYKYLHHEPVYDIESWDLPDDLHGRLSSANTKTPYNIFVRDRAIFEKEFTKLKIREVRPHTCLIYLLSGGLSRRCFVPASMTRVAWFVERMLAPFYRFLGTRMTVVVEKV